MALTPYPKYRIVPCLDDSEGENKEVFLIQTKRHKWGEWMGCINDSGPLIFDQRKDALAAIKGLTNPSERQTNV
jgi:hypothetical protein